MSGWDEVAADGTDPELLRAVATRLAARGGPSALAQSLRSEADADPTASPGELLRRVVPPTLDQTDDVLRRWRDREVRVALAGDPGYPARLLGDWPAGGAPLLLARRGSETVARPSVAIVGARRASGYGTGVASWLAGAAADAGATVISGGALGIDAAAHGAAAHAGTVVVLGCGHGVDYPRPHAQPGGLFDRVLAGGGAILSEHLPHARPAPHHVRARNRIVAALADVVVVVEGGARSGALVTAGFAADLDVPVLAVPGDVREPGSVAPHRLLSEGAAPCTSPADLLDALGATASSRPSDAASPTVLPGPVRAELARRWPRPVRPDDLATATDLPAARLLGVLTRARVAGEIAESHDGVRLTRAPG